MSRYKRRLPWGAVRALAAQLEVSESAISGVLAGGTTSNPLIQLALKEMGVEVTRNYRASKVNHYTEAEIAARGVLSRQRLHQLRYPDRQAARFAVSRAVKSGKMRPASEYHCVDCGEQAQEYDHFWGYAKEYQRCVVPVCSACHHRRP